MYESILSQRVFKARYGVGRVIQIDHEKTFMNELMNNIIAVIA